MSERTVELSELVGRDLLEIGAGRPRSVNLDGDPLPILRVADVLDGKIESSVRGSISDIYRQTAEPKISRPGDIVLTAKGTVGRVAIMPSEGPCFAYSPQLCYFRPRANGPLLPLYLYYWFKSEDFWTQANALKSQTDMADFLSLSDVQSLKLRLPSLDQQMSVTELLGALDDKIAVNESIAASSDKLLRARHYQIALDAPTGCIEEFGSHVRDQKNPESMLGIEPYIGLEHVPRRSIWLNQWGTADEVTSAKTAFQAGDILFGKLRPYFHKVGLAQVDGICSTDIIVARAKSPDLRPWLLMVMSSDEIVAFVTARSDGTRMPRTKWGDLASFDAPWPGFEAAVEFGRDVSALISRTQSALAENKVLAALRDTLLPKLMSGQLTVKQAESLAEDVT